MTQALVPSQTDQESSGTLLSLEYVYNALNSSFPNLMEDCWLCLDPRTPPPLYWDVLHSTDGGRKTSYQKSLSIIQDSHREQCSRGKEINITLGGMGLASTLPLITCSTLGTRDTVTEPFTCSPGPGYWTLHTPLGTTSGFTPCINPFVVPVDYY